MIIYFAGSDYLTLKKFGVKNILQSYFYVKDKFDDMKMLINNGINLFLDSGAFSAHTKRKRININMYMNYIKRLNPNIYAGLDVIRNAEATKKNMEIMDAQGFKAIPTFHAGSDFKYLYEMVNKYNFIALGGLVGKRQKNILKFLDLAFKIIVKENSKLKVHGFGMALSSIQSIDIMKYYPWYSVDSAYWMNPVIFGKSIIEKIPNIRILRYKTGLKTLTEINKEYTKMEQREIVLEESIKEFLTVEKNLNQNKHKVKFDNLNQLDLWPY